MTSSDLHHRVDGDDALAFGQDDQRIDVDAEQLIAEADGEVRDADNRIAQCIDITRRFAAHAAEYLKAAQTCEHVARLSARQGRDADGNVFEHFDENAAQAAKNDRTEQRIALDAENHFDPVAGHALDDNTVDRRVRHSAFDFALDARERGANFAGIRKSQRDAADIALVRDLVPTRF